jgi:Glycosyl hydrolase family 12
MTPRALFLALAPLFVLACSKGQTGGNTLMDSGASDGATTGTPAGTGTASSTGTGMTAAGTGTDTGTGSSTGTRSGTGTGTVTDTGSASGTGTATGSGVGALKCANPVFVTSDTNGGWSNGGYYVHNNMWNSSAGLGPETLFACSYNNWYVVSNQTDNAGAVKTYPNVHKDYNNVPISSFNTINSTFAATSPHVGIYDVAYDIWTNGVATSGSTEFMIWTENYNQVPAGSQVASVIFGGRTYNVWKTSDSSYIAFVPTVVFTSGTVDLLEIFNWTISKGWLPANSTLGQICFGVEIVATNGGNATFQFTDFSIASS